MSTIRSAAFGFQLLMGNNGIVAWYLWATFFTAITILLVMVGVLFRRHSTAYFDVMVGITWFMAAFFAFPVIVEISLGTFPIIYGEIPAIGTIILWLAFSVILHFTPKPTYVRINA